MSTKVQRRRGTAAQHENYAGAMSEFTHDTTNNNIRVHDGNTLGGHATLMEGQLGMPHGVTPLDATGNVPVAHLGNVPKPTSISTRAAIVTTTIAASVQFITTVGFATVGDGGGALYVRVASEPTHAGKVQSADGAWWELSRGQIINIKMFGAVGDGVANDTAAIQSAIDFVCPFIWKGGTRATELGAVSGALFIPVGVFRYTQPLKLSPSLMIYGETKANDWSVQWGDTDPLTGGDRRFGSCLYADISDYNVYAVDTAPYHTDGQRHLGDWLKGSDSYDGLKTEVHGISMRDITFYGKWTCKGLNMAGAVSSMLDNVVIAGFTVGIRYSATWFGSTKDLRILANWKGIISYMSVTDLFMTNTTILKTTTAPAYDPDTMGSDPCLPQTGAWWLPLWNKVTSGIVNVYSSMTAKNLTVEHFQCYSQGQCAANDFQNVHIEGISYIAIISHGPDQNNERHMFETIAGNAADLIACKDSRLEVGCLKTNYTQNGFNRLFFDISTSSFIYKPIIWGLTFKAGETFNSDYITRKDFYNSSGGWGPELRAGGASLGTQSNRGRWVRQGNLVTVWGYLTVSSKNAATGSLTITGLPFVSRDDFGFFAGGIISYAYNSPTAGTPIRIAHNSSSIEIIGKTHADIQNDADLRFSLTYETTENSLW
ncbi:MAG: pectate lyase superfamily protein [Caudoviricetes sp.]|nr:MAG: pectate lyase superfamily protein [Caudoviricetes sp.]